LIALFLNTNLRLETQVQKCSIIGGLPPMYVSYHDFIFKFIIVYFTLLVFSSSSLYE
jgi:hypothetical protein